MFKTTLLAALVLTVAFAMPLTAQVKYNRATETTLDTTVLYVGDAPSGAFIIVKDHATGGGQINEVIVRLGPRSFVESEGLQIAARDSVKIVGSRITADGAEILVAREVTHKGKTFVLRDDKGEPRW